jgi:hypothetical protein
MRNLLACSLFVALAANQAWAEDRSDCSPPPAAEGCPSVFICPSVPVVLVRGYEESLSDALAENALTEEEQADFLVELQATMAVKQAKVELLRAIHQLEAVEKKCKGTPVGDEASQLLTLLPQRKDLQPGQAATATATASRKRASLAHHSRVAPAEARAIEWSATVK